MTLVKSAPWIYEPKDFVVYQVSASKHMTLELARNFWAKTTNIASVAPV